MSDIGIVNETISDEDFKYSYEEVSAD